MTSRCYLERCFISKGICGLNKFERDQIVDELYRLPWFELHKAPSCRVHEKTALEPPKKPAHLQCRVTRDNFFLRDSHSVDAPLRS
jgi:hypothetical protein